MLFEDKQPQVHLFHLSCCLSESLEVYKRYDSEKVSFVPLQKNKKGNFLVLNYVLIAYDSLFSKFRVLILTVLTYALSSEPVILVF